MLKLSAAAREPYWLDLIPGVRVRLLPVTVAMMIAARIEAGNVFREPRADKDPTTQTRASIALVRALARSGLAEWEGVGDEDGEPAPVTSENIDRLLDLWPVHDVIDRLYVGPALVVSTEGNGLPHSPNGTSETAAPGTAPGAP